MNYNINMATIVIAIIILVVAVTTAVVVPLVLERKKKKKVKPLTPLTCPEEGMYPCPLGQHLMCDQDTLTWYCSPLEKPLTCAGKAPKCPKGVPTCDPSSLTWYCSPHEAPLTCAGKAPKCPKGVPTCDPTSLKWYCSPYEKPLTCLPETQPKTLDCDFPGLEFKATCDPKTGQWCCGPKGQLPKCGRHEIAYCDSSNMWQCTPSVTPIGPGCNTHKDCAKLGDRWLCKQGKCTEVECVNDSYCQSKHNLPVCDTETNKCRHCTKDEECGGNYHCLTSGYCGCKTDDCKYPKRCLTYKTARAGIGADCFVCLTDEDCNSEYAKGKCKNGKCDCPIWPFVPSSTRPNPYCEKPVQYDCTDLPKGSPKCSPDNHGKCNTTTKQCDCSDGYYGYSCQYPPHKKI
jgi:hypothetical protein